jgi:hypothetical protein
MNSIIKDPHIIKTGQEWFDMLPKQLQERWLFYVVERDTDSIDRLFKEETTFQHFMFRSFVFAQTEEGHFYWFDVSEGRFGVIQKKKSLLSKIINFFKS